MLRNYIRIAFRNLLKYKFYSLINILGLAIGLTCFLFILVYVKDELSYDRYHDKSEQIYRIHFQGSMSGQEIVTPNAGAPFGPFMVANFPEVENQLRFRERGSYLFRYEETSFKEENIIYADSTLFDVFSLPLLEGDPKTALTEPNTMVITPAVAKKYFGDENPIGKSLRLDDWQNFRVTAIMNPIPSNTHFRHDIFLSMSSLGESRRNEWLSMNFYTYLVLKEGTDPRAFETKFREAIKGHIGGEVQQYLGVTLEDFERQGNRLSFSLFPMTKIHLHSHTPDELAANGDLKYIYIFSAIGLFILLLACINFMNLATARSANRAKEVGLRKVVGAGRGQLIFQFLSESIILTFLALLIAAGALQLLLPHFNTLSAKELTLTQVNQPWLWGSMLVMILGVGVLAGSYPAFFLSAFRPIQTLKGKVASGAKSSLFRNSLVVFQFAITIILIIGSLVVYDQLQYIQNKKLGFNKEQLIILKDAYAMGDKIRSFKEEMKRRPEVVDATISSFLPTPSSRNNSVMILGRNPETSNSPVIYQFAVDFDYISTFDMQVVEGRAFDPDFSLDSSAVVLNEAATKIFGIADDPIGKEVGAFRDGTDPTIFKVIGVVKDFHFDSLREKIGPLAMFLGNSRGNVVMRVNTDNIPGFIATLKQEWDKFAPGQPFAYEFVDEAFASLYEAETRVGSVIRLFTFLAIFVACLGLLGLATYVTEQRTKEIGIRKVLGASVGNIYLMLTSQFVKRVVLANIIALPIGYLAMQRWLQGFEYQAGISWATIVFAALSGAVIAILTVSFHAIRATRLNPVESLKHE